MPLLRFKISLAALFCVMSFSLSAQNGSGETVNWKDWNTGYKEGLSKGKIILVDMYTEWCGWCKKMDRDAYASPEIASKLNKDFVSIKFNPEDAAKFYIDSNAYSGQQLKMMLTQNQGGGYPTTFFLIPKQNIIHVRIYPGYMNAVQLDKVLNEMIAFSKN